MKRKLWIIPVLLLVVLGLAGYFFFSSHTLVDGQLVRDDADTLVWQGSSLTDMDKLYSLTGLRVLNLENADVTPQQYDALKAALPNCRIIWKVPFQNERYPQNTQTLTLRTLTDEDLEVLKYFPELTRINAAGCTDYEALAALRQRFPGCAVHYTVDLAGKAYPEDTTALEVSADDLTALEDALAQLPQVRDVRLSGRADALAVKALAEQYPRCRFAYNISIGGQTVPNDIAELALPPESYLELAELLPCFTALSDVTITGSSQKLDVHALADAYPGIRFHYDFEAFGRTVNTDQDFLDLSGIRMEDAQALEALLPYFHNLKKVDMVNCGLSNEAMAALNDRHPETLFVWKVLIGDRYYRTDINYFYPTGSGLSMVNVDVSNLQYCTELVVLDLGHFLIRDCSFVEHMPKLEYLILAIGPMKDIRPIGTLKELKYLEIFSTRVTDYWPLVNCTKLEALNIGFSGHGDITPLLQMPWLTHLWLSNKEEVYTEDEKALLAQHLPNTIMLYSSGSATNKGWRNTPGYYAMRNILNDRYLND